MANLTSASEQPTAEQTAAPLPVDVERVSAYAWQRGAVETIIFHGAAQLTTAAGALTLDAGTWLLARWEGLSLDEIPDGELVCVLPEVQPEELPDVQPEELPEVQPEELLEAQPEELPEVQQDAEPEGAR
jgi:hypothetical protein